MSAKKNFVYKLSMVVAVWGLVMTSSVLIFGQQAPKQTIGVPDDWTHHRLVFSNPGTAAEAMAAGRYEQWTRMVNDPRYQFQQLKRSLQQRAVAVAPDFASRMAILQRTVNSRSLPFHGRPISLGGQPISKDWNMNLGPFSDATLTASVVTPINSTTLPSSSAFVLDNVTFNSSDPVAASQSGTFTGNPASGNTLKITNGTTITLTASRGTAGTQTGTFSSTIGTQATASNDIITIQNGATNTLTITTNASGANVGATMTNDPHSTQTSPTIKVGSVTTTLSIASGAVVPSATATFSGVPTSGNTIGISSGIQTLTLTAADGASTGTVTVTGTPSATSGQNQLTVGAVTYTFAASCTGAVNPCIVIAGTNHTNADNIEAAINDDNAECSASGCFAAISAPNSEASAGSPTSAGGGNYRTTITNNYYTTVTLSDTETNLTSSGNITATANGCTSATAGTYIIGTTLGSTATNLYNVLNGTACQTSVPITVSGLSGGGFIVAETIYGTTSANAFAETTTNFAWSSQLGNVGTANGCSGSGTAYTASYQAANTLAGLATNVVAALNSCAAGANIFAVAGSGGAYTVYNNTLGSLNTTLTDTAGTPSIVTWGTAASGSAGSNACSSPTTATFQVLPTDNTAAQVATEFVTAIKMCTPAVTTGITNTTSNGGGTSATVTITANKWVLNPGLTLGNTAGGYFAWTATSITNGTNGNGTAPSFAVDNIPADIATNLAADINTAGQGNTVGVTATTSGAQVTISASVAGSSGGAITLTNGLSNITLASPLTCTGGTPACDGTNSSTTFAYWSGSTYATQSVIATNIASALSQNGTITGSFTVGTANLHVPGDIVLTYKTGGLGGNSQNLNSNFTALQGGPFSGGSTTQATAQYPAKYSFSTTDAGLCSNSTTPDYVVYNTNVPGSATQANIVAYDNIYTGCPAAGGAATVPLVYWSYQTGSGIVPTSPVLSGDGTKVAFVESNSTTGNATLRILRWSSGDGTDYNSPATPTNSFTNTTAGAGGNTAWSGCPAGSCMISVAFQTQTNTDSNSSPFYDYSSDTLWVGDDSGYLHKFTGVFNGTPGEVTTTWPALVRSNAVLTGPVLDLSRGLIFVGDSSGFLESVNTSTAAVIASGQIGYTSGVGIIDSPIVDPSAAMVYTFVNDDSGGYGRVSQLVDPLTSGSTGNYNYFLSASSNPVYAGDFDNTYYTSSNAASPTGHLWFCGQPDTLYAVTITANAISNATAATTVTKISNDTTSPCSPVTEFYNGTTDYIFVSPQAQTGTALQSCTASMGCVISFTVSGITATRSGSGAFAGGAGGMVIDTQNTTVGGTLQIYFGILGSNSGCTGAGGKGAGTGGCAVQASQTAP